MNDELLDSTMIPVKKVVEDAHVFKDEILHIVLFGNHQKFFLIEQLFRELFNGKKVYKVINPDESSSQLLEIIKPKYQHVLRKYQFLFKDKH